MKRASSAKMKMSTSVGRGINKLRAIFRERAELEWLFPGAVQDERLKCIHTLEHRIIGDQANGAIQLSVSQVWGFLYPAVRRSLGGRFSFSREGHEWVPPRRIVLQPSATCVLILLPRCPTPGYPNSHEARRLVSLVLRRLPFYVPLRWRRSWPAILSMPLPAPPALSRGAHAIV